MIKNYLKIALRNILKHKMYAVINVVGLATGLAAFLLLSAYISFEQSYDRHFHDYNTIYRLTTDQVVGGEIVVRDAMSFYPSGLALKEEIPEVVGYTTTLKHESIVIKSGNDLYNEAGVVCADRFFLNFFNYKILSGDTSLMAEPNQLILTRAKAIEYFGKEDVAGETLFIHSGIEKSFNVAAVIEDVPANTHYKFDILMSISSIQSRLDKEPWSGYMYYSYLRLVPDVDIERMKPMLASLAKKYIGEKTTLVFNLQPIRDIHLYSDFTFEPEINGSAESLQILTVIAFFILMVAWVNYVNMATARTIDRAKEIGVRKVVGARRIQLMWQFFLESFLINLVGAFIAYLLTILVAPQVNNLLGSPIIQNVWRNEDLINKLLLCFVAGTFVSGFYPAILLSASNPVLVLKGKYRNSKSGIMLRKSLVTFQFVTTLVLITGTLIVTQQIQFMRSKDKGINTDQVIGLALPAQHVATWQASLDRLDKLSNDLTQHGAVLSTAVISNLPGGGSSDINSSSGMQIVGISEFNEGMFYSIGIDDKVVALLEMTLIYGRNFNRDLPGDVNAVLVNESFFKKLGVQVDEKMIGQRIRFGRKEDNPTYEIIGILKDSNRTSMEKEIEPTIYFSDWGYGDGYGYGNLMIKCNAENIEQAIQVIDDKWIEFFPNEVFQYEFLDERFARLYAEDQRFSKIFRSFSLLAIFITMMGLFGLSSFMAAQRTKEVGVRRVLGATVLNILYVFFYDILKLIAFSLVLGIPLVVITMTQWLEGYAYRITFPVWTLLISMLILLSLSFLTISYQTLKVAVTNPVKSLRSE